MDLVAHLTSDPGPDTLTNGYDVLEGTMNLVQAIYLNNAVAPFDNEKVRQALCYAVDCGCHAGTDRGRPRHQGGLLHVPQLSASISMLLWLTPITHDVEKAKELLTEAGYPNGFTFTIKVPSNYTPHVNTALVLKEQLAAGGHYRRDRADRLELLARPTFTPSREFEGTVVGFDAS